MAGPLLQAEIEVTVAGSKFYVAGTNQEIPRQDVIRMRESLEAEREQQQARLDTLAVSVSVAAVDVAKWDALLLSAGELVGQTLSEVQAVGLRAIDIEAERRITQSGGFEYPVSSGTYFSMSVVAQVKWTGLYTVRDLLTYPVSVPTIDDVASLSLVNAAAVQGIYLTMIGTVRAVLDAATTAKVAVMAAASAAEVATTVAGY